MVQTCLRIVLSTEKKFESRTKSLHNTNDLGQLLTHTLTPYFFFRFVDTTIKVRSGKAISVLLFFTELLKLSNIFFLEKKCSCSLWNSSLYYFFFGKKFCYFFSEKLLTFGPFLCSCDGYFQCYLFWQKMQTLVFLFFSLISFWKKNSKVCCFCFGKDASIISSRKNC